MMSSHEPASTRRELRAIRQRRLQEEYAAAASDPAFMEEMVETGRDLDGTVADGLEDI